MDTRFTALVGCELPLQLATLGGVGTAELALAVAREGGLGMMPAGVDPPTEVPVGGALGIGFLMPFGPSLDEVSDTATKVRVVEFFYDSPRADLVAAVHGGGALAAWQVGSVNEAVAAEAAGCDFVVAQGREAGGHVRGTMPLLSLLPAVLQAVNVPVVGAGGIATAQDVRALLALGADAVRVGTRFVATEESGAHPTYIAALIAAGGPEDTVLTTHFDDGWPGAPHRVLRVALEQAEMSGNHGVMPPDRSRPGDVRDAALYAGEGVGAITKITSAGAVVRELLPRI
jgi:nitronate monooxygenase